MNHSSSSPFLPPLRLLGDDDDDRDYDYDYSYNHNHAHVDVHEHEHVHDEIEVEVEVEVDDDHDDNHDNNHDLMLPALPLLPPLKGLAGLLEVEEAPGEPASGNSNKRRSKSNYYCSKRVRIRTENLFQDNDDNNDNNNDDDGLPQQQQQQQHLQQQQQPQQLEQQLEQQQQHQQQHQHEAVILSADGVDHQEISPDYYHQSRVAKYFDAVLFFGTVVYSFQLRPLLEEEQEQEQDDDDDDDGTTSNPPGTWCWNVQYDDGDQEDWILHELQSGLQLCQLATSNIATTTATTCQEKEAPYLVSPPPAPKLEPNAKAIDPATNTTTTTTTKPSSSSSWSANNSNNKNTSFIHSRVAKFFDNEVFFGTVIERFVHTNDDNDDDDDDDKNVSNTTTNTTTTTTTSAAAAKPPSTLILWVIDYDDGDSEDWDTSEVQLGLKLCTAQVEKAEYDLWTIYHVYPWTKEWCQGLPLALTQHRETVAKFYLFLLERQRCWMRRKTHSKQHPHYWTNCKVLRHYFFCNNYRQLDRGTAYFHSQILDLWEEHQHQQQLLQQQPEEHQEEQPISSSENHWKDWFVQVLWASYCYRLVNKVESFLEVEVVVVVEGTAGVDMPPTAAGFGRIPKIQEWPEFKAFILQSREENLTFFTGAHQTCSFANYIQWMDSLHESPEILEHVAAATAVDHTIQSCYGAIIKNLPGCGAFMAWQITCDLLESKCFWNNITEIDFCVLGKGAKAGIVEIFFPRNLNSSNLGIKTNEYLEYTQLLVDHQEEVYEHLTKDSTMKLVFPKWRNQPLTLKEMEHALCEFSKYQRLERSMHGGSATAQRRRKSRAHLDQRLQCFQCQRDDSSKKDDITNPAPTTASALIMCDTCNQGYCDQCCNVDSSYEKDPISWICRRCEELEGFRWVGALDQLVEL